MVVIKFGGGLNTRMSSDIVAEPECVDGENFSLDIEHKNLHSRNPFALADTAPNGEPIRGYAQLQNRDNQITTLIQAGGDVYKWDGSTFTSVGTCHPSSRLRGPKEANWLLDDLVVITDLALQTPVHTWNGTNFTEVDFGLSNDFFAKYALVTRERVLYANVASGTPTPQVMAGTELSTYNVVSTTERPPSGPGTTSGSFFGESSVSIGVDDAFYLPVPDGRPINGIIDAFDEEVVLSTEEGRIFRLQGETSQDFQMKPLFPKSGAAGDESMVFTGNDIQYGRQGRIESLVATIAHGDVELDDPSLKINPTIEDVKAWTSVYDARRHKTYFWPEDGGRVYVFHKTGNGLSPWSVYTTQHSTQFNQTCTWSMLDPLTGLQGVFWGDQSGNVYRMDADNEEGDAGTTSVQTKWLTGLFSVPEQKDIHNMSGYVRYRGMGFPASITLTMLWGGTKIHRSESMTLQISEPYDAEFYNDAAYFNDGNGFGTVFEKSFVRKPISPTGQSEEFQIEIIADSKRPIEINEIGLSFGT